MIISALTEVKIATMKKTYFISCIISIIISIVCLSSCQKCPNEYTPIDQRIAADTFKVGSYFIYLDSVDQIIDSEYVYQYYFSPHYLINYTDGCAYYADELQMYESSFRNGTSYNDTIVWTFAGFMVVFDYKWLNLTGDSDPALNPGSDMTIVNYTIAGTTYPIVYKSSNQALIPEGSDTIHADIYFATGYGIVQRIEHRPTGDVPWNLIRYHIVQ